MTLTEHLAELARPRAPARLEIAPGGWLRDGPGAPMQARPARVQWQWTDDADAYAGREIAPRAPRKAIDWLPVPAQLVSGHPVTVYARHRFEHGRWLPDRDPAGDCPARHGPDHRRGVLRGDVFHYSERRYEEWLDI